MFQRSPGYLLFQGFTEGSFSLLGLFHARKNCVEDHKRSQTGEKKSCSNRSFVWVLGKEDCVSRVRTDVQCVSWALCEKWSVRQCVSRQQIMEMDWYVHEVFITCLGIWPAVIWFITDAFWDFFGGYLCGLCLSYEVFGLIVGVLMSTETSLVLQRETASQLKAVRSVLLPCWSTVILPGRHLAILSDMWRGGSLLPSDTHVRSNVKRETRSFWPLSSPLAWCATWFHPTVPW